MLELPVWPLRRAGSFPLSFPDFGLCCCCCCCDELPSSCSLLSPSPEPCGRRPFPLEGLGGVDNGIASAVLLFFDSKGLRAAAVAAAAVVFVVDEVIDVEVGPVVVVVFVKDSFSGVLGLSDGGP